MKHPPEGAAANAAVAMPSASMYGDTSLRVLMIAPQPLFRPRGTPFSVLARIRALIRLGHTVDLVTYPFGERLDMPGLRVHRSARPPLVRDVRIGPSLAKAVLDVPLFMKAYRLACSEPFDLLHTHEEACFIGRRIAGKCGIPHLYDMHSSLPEQLSNFHRYDRAPLRALFRHLERRALEGADAVIAICPALAERVREQDYRGELAVIENTLDALPPAPVDPGEVRELARELDVADRPVVVYTGSLEPYQGLDILIGAAARVCEREDVAFVVVGGTPEQIEALRARAEREGVAHAFRFVPAVDQERVHVFQKLATVLVTPRSSGTNTPLKIYQYLRAGRPILATDIPAHTQVLDEGCAELVPVDAEAVAEGLERLLADPVRRRRLADAADRLARRRYDPASYLTKLSDLLERLEHPSRAGRKAAR